MAAKLESFDLVLLIDANGDYAVGKCQDTAAEAYEQDVGALSESGGFRIVNLTVKATLPESVELEGVIGGEGKAQLVLK
jgi:hypothetical protein